MTRVFRPELLGATPVGRQVKIVLSRSAGVSAWATMARAVPSASLPIRNTTVLPVRNTPVASANTFGRPSKTNPTTPSGARRDETDHCG